LNGPISPIGIPEPGEIRVRLAACGVCRMDLQVVDGELPDPKVPIIPGHEIVGRIDAIGAAECLLSGVKRASYNHSMMSACDRGCVKTRRLI
jgi:D-arabinose 1-dehydrogenase-like Zn-dependent alcohol dehydrogenase